MAPRLLLLLLQLCALAASSPVDAALPLPPPPSRDASATTGDTNDVATAAVSSGARRLGPPHHLRVLSDIPADAPNAAADDYYDMPTDAPAPVAVAVDRPSLRPRHYPRVPTCRRAGIVKGAEMLASTVAGLYAASKTAHEKATRVRPLGQDAVEAAGH
ncbi:unnamed protein product [Urochloa humidicola]